MATEIVTADAPTFMILAKGFRVSEDSEEFQLVWPPTRKALTYESERRLVDHSAWPAVLGALYVMGRQDIGRLRCVLLTPESTTSVAVSQSRDRFGRPMVVAVGATASISWSSTKVEETVSLVSSASQFVAAELAKRFDGNPREILAELKGERFSVGLEEFQGPAAEDLEFWNSVIRCARQWRGIRGLAHPPLVALGGNVVLGTEHEAVRFAATGNTSIDGFYDGGTQRIVPTSRNLSRWPHSWEPQELAAQPVEPEPVAAPAVATVDEVARSIPEREERLASIERSIKNIDRSVTHVSSTMTTLLDLLRDWLFGKGKRKK